MLRKAIEVQGMHGVQWQRMALQIKTVLDRWNQNLVTRRQLRKLTNTQLADIGIDRYTANLEADKPFWRD